MAFGADLVKRNDDYKIDLAPHIADECKPKCHVIVDLYNDLTTKGCKPFGKDDECIKTGCAAVEELFECSECLVNATSSDYKGLAAIAIVKGKEFGERFCKEKNFPTNK
ncbi:hypothetical protein A1Q1_07673 [Trichosporon asahii var. asahii CBS 2479]|nr:hypothetical protein A1Q1_07673 [Trichosporon asahii var. asahii CBS 2479]EJT51078.1 hypothetical protein A1Q1_07673 [Trichosporon asahii var. asahii CBS 2479]